MPSLKAIRLRIASVRNTQKITRAMKMVAAARLRRAQQRILELRPYAQKTAQVLEDLAERTEEQAELPLHPLMEQRPVKKVLILMLTGDRGLCGAYNSNIQRMVERRCHELKDEGMEVSLATIGRKGRDYFRRRNYTILHDFLGTYEGGSAKAASVARQLVEDFVSGTVDQVLVAFSEFRSTISQRPILEQLLPIRAEAAEDENRPKLDFIYEPSRMALINRLLPMYVEVTVYRAVLESNASEQGARMTAMENASQNAKAMIDTLTLQYNRARQAAITKELMEIIGGAEALKD